jgi:hypothetical protein
VPGREPQVRVQASLPGPEAQAARKLVSGQQPGRSLPVQAWLLALFLLL